MNEVKENENLISFWNQVCEMSEEDKQEALKSDPESWKTDVASEKLYNAASSLGSRKKVLDYGCGHGWASVIIAKNGCEDVTAVDVSENTAAAAALSAKVYDVEKQMKAACVSTDYLHTVEDCTYDGIFCSNVIDVLPPKTAEDIIKEMARISTDDASIVIGMNNYVSREKAEKAGLEIDEDGLMHVDGVLRMVPRTDEEWTEIFSEFFTVEKLDHFAWPGEPEETRRLFFLKKKIS